tara:strand:- start:75 stop:482 length:408 start_codon:yes stop_codon:yes gene_type:complete
MTQNAQLRAMLVDWGRYVRTGNDPGIGYPRECAYTKLAPRGSGFDSVPDDVSKLEMSNRAVQIMTLVRPELGAILWAEYRFGGKRDFRLNKWNELTKSVKPNWKPLKNASYTLYLDKAESEFLINYRMIDSLSQI